jgi:outer membrane protein insertion porin family
VTYRIEKREAARVAPPLIDGEIAPYTREALLSKAHLRPGDRYRESRARADASRIQKFLYGEDRLKAAVELIAAQPTPDGRVAPVYRVSVGPMVVFETSGISARRVRREVRTLLESQTLDEDVILQYTENKRRDLQRRGHYRARVHYEIESEPVRYTVRLTIEPGPKFRVERIVFRGNTSIADRKLRSLMVTQPAGLPLLRSGRLIDEELSADVSAILGHYQTHGWVGAKVLKPDITQGSRSDRLLVAIPIEEGPQAIVTTRSFVGNEHFSEQELGSKLQVRVGKPFNPNDERQDVETLQSFYRDRGWSEASVRDEYVLSADRTSVSVTYRIEEGIRSFFGKTVVRGNTFTSETRIRRLAAYREGAPFSESAILTTERNLTRAGVFRRVDVRGHAPRPPGQERVVDIEVEEGRRLSILYGIGYQYAPEVLENKSDPFLVGGLTFNNIFGKMISAGFEGQYALSHRFKLQMSVREPFLFSKDYPFAAFFFWTREPIQQIDIERLGLTNEVSRRYSPFLRVALRAEYQQIRPVRPEDLSVIERSRFPRFNQPIQEATIGPTFFYDRRDDAIEPHGGYYLSLAGKYAFPAFGAQARYTKVSATAALFRPVGRAVLAVAGRAGAIFPYGPRGIPIPIAQRFFSGKNSSNRGFDTDTLGIPGETIDYNTRATLHTGSGSGSCAKSFPELSAYRCDAGPRIVGGNGLLAFNAELRFPVAGPVAGAVFYDLAQVWKNFSDVNLKVEGQRGLRQSIGLGLRVGTPIGPLRVDYGLPIERRRIPFDVILIDKEGNPQLPPLASGSVRETGQFFVSIGYPF